MYARSPLLDLDFALYRRMLARVLPAGAQVALCDGAGAVQHADAGFPVCLLAGRARPGTVEPAADSPSLGSTRRLALDGRAACAVPLRAESGEPTAELWVSVPDPQQREEIDEALRAVAAILARDLRQNSELNDMAAELIERYEELNLVYHTEDQVGYFAEGQQALDRLVRNCRDYLNVSIAALVMPDRGISILHIAAGQQVAEPQFLLDRLASGVYERVAFSGSSLVINDLVSLEALGIDFGIAGRLLATPLAAAGGTVAGMLAIVNSYDQPKFTNSDKNLLEVMARKVGKIVQVSYDVQTGLVNREGFEYFANQQHADAQAFDNTHCVLHLDIDQLHVINDTVSHDAGNAVIQAVGAMLRDGLRGSEIVSRLGGDEFAVLLRNCRLDHAVEIADRLREDVAALVVPWSGRKLGVTVSIGVAELDAQAQSAGAAMTTAELACSAAKELGKNRVQSYDHSDTGLIKRHHEMEAVGRIQTALEDNLFELHSQPIECLAGGSAGLHLEVLLRMRDAGSGLLSPAQFLPAAERYDLMPEIDRWVVTESVSFLNAHNERLLPRLAMFAINLSGQSLNEPTFLKFLGDCLTGLKFPLDRLCFEITETIAVRDIDVTRAFIEELKQGGCRFALDDFGSGLSSFSYLRSLTVDYLKIEGSIVREIVRDPIAASMVGAVQQVARVMGIETIAEFVETEAIKDALKDMGVSFAQGYAIGRPRPLADLVKTPTQHDAAAAR